MEELFGISMNSIMLVMLALLVLSLTVVLWVAIRRPVIFRMGMRNIPRRKTQSLLIVFGLMLATLITSASLTVGDTLNHSIGGEIYHMFGEVDELVISGNSDDDDVNILAALQNTVPQSAVDDVRAHTEDLEVDAVGGVILTFAPAISIGDSAPADVSNPLALFEQGTASEPSVGVIGLDQQTATDFNIRDIDGNPVDVDALGSDKVYITQKLADEIDIGVGGYIVYVLNNQFYVAEVAGITENQVLTGSFNAPNTPGILANLDQVREATGISEGWSAVVVSNSGDSREGLQHSGAVAESLNSNLEGTGMVTSEFKSEQVDAAELAGSLFVTMFIGFGLFSISVGVLLIVLIFTMLAAERRGEMGMARAIGGQRSMLVQQFLSEGAGYTLLAGLVGTTLGVGAAWIIARAVSGMTGGFFAIEMYVHPRSLVIAYALGVIITFAAVIFSSWRASRLNIVAALRDIPEVSNPRQSKRPLIFSVIAIVLGAYLIYLGETTDTITWFLIGISIVPFAIAAITNWFGINNKWVLTAVGLFVLVVWSMPTDMFNSIFGDMGTGGIELFLLSGLAMVASSTLLIMQHMDVLLKLVQAMGSRVKGWLGSVRLGVAYPKANGGRSGMTIAMFSLIVFSIVVMASVNNIFTQVFMGGDAMAGTDVQVQMMNTNQIDDISAELESSGVNMDGVTGPGKEMWLGTLIDEMQVAEGDQVVWETAPSFVAVDDTWVDMSQLKFQARAEGYESDEAVWEALKTEPNVVVMNSTSAVFDQQSANQPAMMGATNTIQLTETSEGVFVPYTIVARGELGEEIEITVIGVLDSEYTMLSGAYLSVPTLEALDPEAQPLSISYNFKVDDSRDASEVAADMERALLQYGAQGIDVAEMMKEFQSQQSGFMNVMQWFMGLGLIVGIAAVGVIAYRAVVERRQQIGVLRALGFQSKTIGNAFVIETGIIVILGSLAGVILGLIVSFNLVNDPDLTGGADITFQAPWFTILVVLGLAIGMALLMSYLPARQASRTLPAEALRYE